MNTEDFALHDICPTLETYSSTYAPLRVSVNQAMNQSIHHALSLGDAASASEKLMGIASSPGLDVEGKVYESAVHHSRLVELLATYLLSIDKYEVPSPIKADWGDFQPQSFLIRGNRLLRVVLCDRWTPERENLERFSWRTAVDTALSNLPMTIIAMVIGGLREGRRASPWTQGFVHPQSGGVRVLKRDGEQFGENWRRIWREESSVKTMEWLRIMQQDGAFDGRVFSIIEDVPRNRDEVLGQIEAMAGEMGSMRQTRSNCYRFKPCAFLPACMGGKSPSNIGWVEKSSLTENLSAKLPVTI